MNGRGAGGALLEPGFARWRSGSGRSEPIQSIRHVVKSSALLDAKWQAMEAAETPVEEGLRLHEAPAVATVR